MKTYDMIVSLGGSCAAASQLKLRAMRQCSLPFDWLFTLEATTLDRLGDCFKNDFAHWLEWENLEELTGDKKRPNAAKYQYLDKFTGYRFIHDFNSRINSKAEFSHVRDKYRRRIIRFMEMLCQADSILFVFDAHYAGCEEKLPVLRQVILEKLGGKKTIDIVLVRYNAERQCVLEKEGLTVYSFTHEKSEYVYKYPHFEFAFLDDCCLSGKIKLPGGRNDKLYIERTTHGIKVFLFKNKRQIFRVALMFGHYEVDFRIGCKNK